MLIQIHEAAASEVFSYYYLPDMYTGVFAINADMFDTTECIHLQCTTREATECCQVHYEFNYQQSMSKCFNDVPLTTGIYGRHLRWAFIAKSYHQVNAWC